MFGKSIAAYVNDPTPKRPGYLFMLRFAMPIRNLKTYKFFLSVDNPLFSGCSAVCKWKTISKKWITPPFLTGNKQ
jgi:hypothetical protein